jgi:hypothetical protein
MIGLSTKEDLVSVVKAVAPKPVNVLVMGPGLSAAEYTHMGSEESALEAPSLREHGQQS